jgi:hypothetical protein
MATERKPSHEGIRKRFGSEVDVEALTGISRRTLQKDRFFNHERFPSYRVGGKILYDLDEVEQVIRASRSSGGAAA